MRRTAELTVERAAIRIDGVVYDTPRPGRHHDIIKLLAEKGFPTPIIGEQGFVLSDGTFVGRLTARIIALEAGQVEYGALIAPPWLFSEDVW